MTNTELYYQYHKRMFFYALKILGHSEDAEDICMQVWSAYCEVPRMAEDRHMLMTMTRNACLNKLTKKEIHTQELRDVDIEDILVEAEVLDQLYQAVNELPEQMGKVITMFYREQKGYAEIQDTLHITKNTISNHLKAGRKHLRNNPALKIAMQNKNPR